MQLNYDKIPITIELELEEFNELVSRANELAAELATDSLHRPAYSQRPIGALKIESE